MKKKISFCTLLFVILISSCRKSISFTGNPGELVGGWKVSTLVKNDLTSIDMGFNFKEDKTLFAFDGCNAGSTTYTADMENNIQMGFPTFTYMYCNRYQSLFGAAFTNARKYSVTSKTLRFYNENGDMILSATRDNKIP